jgi:hypothetical protein
MSLNYAPSEVTAETYARIFAEEQARSYPIVDALEARLGYEMPRERLEDLARVLSCPYKAAAPCWQHGRVLYAVTRDYLTGSGEDAVIVLDIGTAKGFSAMSMLSALMDSNVAGWVTSVDVMHGSDGTQWPKWTGSRRCARSWHRGRKRLGFTSSNQPALTGSRSIQIGSTWHSWTGSTRARL